MLLAFAKILLALTQEINFTPRSAGLLHHLRLPHLLQLAQQQLPPLQLRRYRSGPTIHPPNSSHLKALSQAIS